MAMGKKVTFIIFPNSFRTAAFFGNYAWIAGRRATFKCSAVFTNAAFRTRVIQEEKQEKHTNEQKRHARKN